MNRKTPIYTHDCKACDYLGPFEHRGVKYDLYYADHGGSPDTLIARFGNEYREYISGIPLVKKSAAITEAHKRAKVLGFFD